MIARPDFLTDKVDSTFEAAARTLDCARFFNAILVYSNGGREVAIPLEARILLCDKLIGFYPEMVAATADLVGLGPVSMLAAVSRAHGGDSRLPFVGRRWLRFLMGRLRSRRPNYVVLIAPLTLAELAMAGVGTETLRTMARMPRPGDPGAVGKFLAVLGVNCIKFCARIARIGRRGGRICVGAPVNVDVVCGGNFGGILATVYRPSAS